MTLSFSSAIGNLFNRLGKVGALVKNLRSYLSTQLTAMTDPSTGVEGQYNSEPDLQAVMGSAYIGILSGTGGSLGGTVQSLAHDTVNRMVFRDNPQPGQSLTSSNNLASLQEMIRQMKVSGASVLAVAVAATPGSFTGVGNGAVVASTKRPVDGLVLENTFAENILLVCSSDSYSGSRSAGNETIQVTGAGNQSDVFAFNWPLGSNCRSSLTVIDGNTSNGRGNLLTNSGFATWVAGAPSNFIVDAGSATISQETGLVYDGTSALKITGDGTTLTALRQPFGNGTTGTAGTLSPLSQYAVNVYLRRDGAAAANGTLTIDLVDAGNNVLNDQNNAANSFSINLTQLTTSYQAFGGVFRTAQILTATPFLRLRLTGTPLTVNRGVYLDKLAMGQMTRCYTGGPSLACFAGSIPLASGDYLMVAVTNGRGAAGTLDTWQTLAWRMFPEFASSELLLPSSSSPTLSDTLIS